MVIEAFPHYLFRNNIMQTTLDGGSVFQNVIDNNQKSFSVFELLEDVVHQFELQRQV